MTVSGPDAARRRLAAVLVAAAAWLAYGSTIHNYFVQDDFGVVALLASKPATYFPRWFVSTWMDHIWGYTPDEIRPFPAVSYQLTALWGATSPVANHLLNIALHAANGLLVLAIARRAGGLGELGAVTAALVFVLMPAQAESVAWITGRVDSMPACFYLASFLLWVEWRRRGAAWRYAASLGLFFVALFTKQNTITLAPALVLFDLVVLAPRTPELRRPPALIRSLLAYVPFVLLTGGYLALRYALFGAVVREDQLTHESLGVFSAIVARHANRLVLGTPASVVPIAAVLAALAAAVALLARRTSVPLVRLIPVALYFGALWTALGILPIAVAGYESPRHIYLASVGWAVTIGLVLDVVAGSRPVRVWRPVAATAAMVVLLVYAVELGLEVRTWNVRAAVSQQAVIDLEREALAMPPGALVIAGAPVRSWEWALPFSARPPYTGADLTSRVRIVTPMRLHCCRHEWEDYTRRTLRAWQAESAGAGILALHWNPDSGRLATLTDGTEPYLRALVTTLIGTDNAGSLDQGILDTLDELVAPRARGR